MNIFISLKDTITNVKKDLTSGFHSKPSTAKSDLKIPGQKLLLRYAQWWKEISLNTDSMGRQADMCDRLVSNLSNRVIEDKSTCHQLISDLQSLEKMATDIKATKLQIGNINSSCEQLEGMLLELEGLNKKCQHLALMDHMEKEFNGYCQRRLREHESCKRSMAEQHKTNVEKLQRCSLWKKRERHKVFEEAHKEEMDNYRIFGKIIQNYIQHKNSEPDLSEINFNDEDSLKELEHFLGSEFKTSVETEVTIDVPEENSHAESGKNQSDGEKHPKGISMGPPLPDTDRTKEPTSSHEPTAP